MALFSQLHKYKLLIFSKTWVIQSQERIQTFKKEITFINKVKEMNRCLSWHTYTCSGLVHTVYIWSLQHMFEHVSFPFDESLTRAGFNWMLLSGTRNDCRWQQWRQVDVSIFSITPLYYYSYRPLHPRQISMHTNTVTYMYSKRACLYLYQFYVYQR